MNDYSKAPVWYQPFLQAFDDKDLSSILELLTDDCILIVGGRPPAVGKKAIEQVYQTRWPMIKRSAHNVLRSWEFNDLAIIQGETTWTRWDDEVAKGPFVHIVEHEDGLIKKCQVYIDTKSIYG